MTNFNRYFLLAVFSLAAVCANCQSVCAQSHPSVPALSSSPGAAYTVYLDFGGFTFNGGIQGTALEPGVTPAYDTDGNASTFSATELANIKNVWSRAAEKYAPFNVNVTTVDPAVAANQAANDTQRQQYYDNQAKMMHTVVGGNGSWVGGGGMTPSVGATATAQPGNNGYHTNWVFSGVPNSNNQFVGDSIAHENGHGLGLNHQSVYNGNNLVSEYNPGTGSGAGTEGPLMGISFNSGRGNWIVGTSDTSNGLGPSFPPPVIQNDVQSLLANPGMTLVSDGIGHTMQSATSLPLSGLVINSASAKGIIVPASSVNPQPTGEANYTADWWSFNTGAGAVALTVHSGRSTITPGVADFGKVLDSTLRLFNSNGNLVASSATTSLDETISMALGSGTYYAEVVSAGDSLGLGYFDMGSYFLSGSLVAVPEPSGFAIMALGIAGLSWAAHRRRRRK